MPPRKKTIPVVETVTELVVEPVAEPKQKTKREKKTKHTVVAVITPNGIQGSFQPEQKRPLIAQLPIHSVDVQFHDQPIMYDPLLPQPEAFDAADINPFSEEATYESLPPSNDNVPQSESDDYTKVEEILNDIMMYDSGDTKQVNTTNTNQPQTTSPRKEYGPQKLLICNQSSKTTHELPSSTNVACFWCCESFEGRPCIIPTSVTDTIWNVYGNFCTPNCALAYLLSEVMDTHTRWERIALLNRLYSPTVNGRVYPAPSRESLQRFGGPITPGDFRSICESKQIRVDIVMPPMVSILASMDTKPIDFYETTIQNSFSTNYQSILQKVHTETQSSGLKLKRSKPLKDKESTLDSCLQIKVR